MSRELTTGLSQQIARDEITLFFATELFFDTQTLRFWSGLGEVELDGDTYVGSGNMLQISSIDESADISAKGAALTLSGIPSEMISLALSEPYQGRKCKIFFGVLGGGDFLLQEDGSYVLNEAGGRLDTSPPAQQVMTQVFSGYIDQMTIDEGPETCTIAVGVESRLIDLERARVRRYTDQSQKARFASDRGFEFVNSLQDKKFAWGR